ncbi:MAG: DUF4367 domain-containing protein [Clostridium sp.]|nr:DUF4367 domain-containing protein [Clostridium sp.]
MKNKIEGIDEEFQSLGSMLSNIDFSKDTDKDEVYEKTIKNIKKEEGNNMNRKKLRNCSIAAATLLIVSLVAIKPTWAVEAFNNVLKTIHLEQVEYNHMSHDKVPLPDWCQGKVFDKDGNPVTESDPYDRDRKLYTADGKEIYEMKNQTIITVDEKDKYLVKVTDQNEINDYINFDIRIPEYIPDGFTFDRGESEKYHEDDPKGSLRGMAITFKNGDKEFTVDEFNNEGEPLAIMGTEDMKKFTLDGIDFVEYENGILYWNKDDISYGIAGEGVDRDTLIKIAESIK